MGVDLESNNESSQFDNSEKITNSQDKIENFNENSFDSIIDESEIVEFHKEQPFDYNKSSSTKLIDNTINFLNNINTSEFTNNLSTVLVDVHLFKNYFIPNSYKLTDNDLFTNFYEGGHCIAFNFTQSYNVPLFFDIDCIDCKEKNHNKTSIVISMIKIIVEEFKNFIEKKFKLISINDYGIYTAGNCGFHLYFFANMSVSLIVYNFLVDSFNQILINEKISHLKVDKVSYMPLPYSAKSNENEIDVYTPKIKPNASSVFNVPVTYLDFELKIKSNISHDYAIASLIHKLNFEKVDEEWDKLDENLLYLTVNEENVRQFYELNPLIANLKYNKFKITNCKITNLNEFFKGGDFEMPKMKDINYSHIENLEVVNDLIHLGRIIASILEYRSYDNYKNITYVFQLASTPNNSFGNAFHVIISIIKFILMKTHIYNSSEESMDIQLDNYIVFLSKILRKISYEIFNTKLDYIFDVLEKYPSVYRTELVNIYSDPVAIFKYLTEELWKFERQDKLSFEIPKFLKGFYFETDLVERVIRFKLFIVRDNKHFYVYENLVYKIFDEAKNSESMKYIENLLRLMANEKENLTHYVPLALKRIKETTIFINNEFGKYRYFINTKFGIFNSLTGTYMSHIPYIYFLNIKQCGLLFEPKLLNIDHKKAIDYLEGLNQMNLNKLYYLESLIDKLQKNEYNVLIKSVIVSGLLICEYSSFDTNSIMHTMKLILKTFTKTSNYELYDPIFKHHKFSPKVITQLAYVIKCSIQNSQAFEDITKLKKCWKLYVSDFSNYDNCVIDYNKSSIDQLYKFGNKELRQEFYILSQAMLILIYHSQYKELISLINFEILPHTPEEEVVLKKMKLGQWLDFNSCSFKKIQSVERVISEEFNIDPMDISLLSSLFVIFSFDIDIILDFLKLTCLIYQPFNENKKFILFIGSTNAGKTHIQNLMTKVAQPNHFGVSTVLKKAKNTGPDPTSIEMARSALTTLAEIKYIESSYIKILTGADPTTMRKCFKNDHDTITSISVVIGGANTYPQMFVDEAIRERLAPFAFYNSFIKNDRNIEENPLIHSYHKTIPGKEIDQTINALSLSNLQYATYRFFRNANANIYAEVKNPISLKLIKDILIRNDKVYKILFKHNIDVRPGASISQDELINTVKETLAVEELSEIEFLRMFREKFINTIPHEGNYYYGIGLIDIFEQEKTNIEIMKKNENSFVTVSAIKQYLNSKIDNLDDRNKLFIKIKFHYRNYFDGQKFNNLELK